MEWWVLADICWFGAYQVPKARALSQEQFMDRAKHFRNAWVELASAEKSRQLTLMLSSEATTREKEQWRPPWWTGKVPSSIDDLPCGRVGRHGQKDADYAGGPCRPQQHPGRCRRGCSLLATVAVGSVASTVARRLAAVATVRVLGIGQQQLQQTPAQRARRARLAVRRRAVRRLGRRLTFETAGPAGASRSL